ncbi:hypothetical protein [Solidesulfovibrio magneticus]|nr:hypothetical protein [Solidesulfovibrio magneticus]
MRLDKRKLPAAAALAPFLAASAYLDHHHPAVAAWAAGPEA